jgi:hypothetical protein
MGGATNCCPVEVFLSLQWSKIEVHKICTEKRQEFGVEEKMGVGWSNKIVAQLRFYPFLQWSKRLEIS